MLIAVFTGALKWYSNCNSAGTETRQPRDWVRWTAEKVQNNVSFWKNVFCYQNIF